MPSGNTKTLACYVQDLAFSSLGYRSTSLPVCILFDCIFNNLYIGEGLAGNAARQLLHTSISNSPRNSPQLVSGTYRMFDLLDQALRQGGLVYSTEIRKE